MIGGYLGKILNVNLSSGLIESRETDFNLARKLIGGVGLAAKILFDETHADTDPLSADNVLIMMTGPLTGTPLPTSGRHAVVAKSPMTNAWGECDTGGSWGASLKSTGYDGVIVRGSSEQPVYLLISEDKVELHAADELWGKDCFETTQLLHDSLGKRISVACIGQAGEKLVRMAGIFHDGIHARAAARTGMGAVMGSKLLKAVVVVKGSSRVVFSDKERVIQEVRIHSPKLRDNLQHLTTYGTNGGTVAKEIMGDLPIQNWRLGNWTEGAQKISGQSVAASILINNYSCQACPIGCGREVKIDNGQYAGVHTGGPEYETAAALGSLCMVDDIEAIAYANELCNRYGIDTISVGGVIAFAIEAYEKGLITAKDTNGVELKWGDPAVMIELIRNIGERRNIGDLLAEGTQRAAEQIGQGAAEFAIHVKGLEPACHDPRAYQSVALGYATSNRGACHLAANSHMYEAKPQVYSTIIPGIGLNEISDRTSAEGKAKLVARTQDLMGMFDSLKLCKFIESGGITVPIITGWLNAVTGWDISIDEFMCIGERIWNLRRMYNVRAGIRAKDDILPNRLLHERRGTGGSAENLPEFDIMRREYYALRGWDENGVPLAETLARLGVDNLLKEI